MVPEQIPPGSIWPLQGQSEPGSKGNEGVLHILQIFRIKTSPSDAVQCHT